MKDQKKTKNNDKTKKLQQVIQNFQNVLPLTEENLKRFDELTKQSTVSYTSQPNTVPTMQERPTNTVTQKPNDLKQNPGLLKFILEEYNK